MQSSVFRSIRAVAVRAAVYAFLAAVFALGAAAQGGFTTSADGNTIEVQEASDLQVVAISKSVIVHGSAKDVFASGGNVTVEGGVGSDTIVIGGDAIIHGRVEGDVFVLGGSVIQKDGAFIGGDIIVFGGEYRYEGSKPGRSEGKQTIVYGILGDELRDLGQNPAQVLSPSLTPVFFAQRVLSVLFWFIVSMILATLAPGAMSRAISRLRLNPVKAAGFGLLGLFLTTLIISAGAVLLPASVSTMTAIMLSGLLLLAYLFGRTTVQLSLGKALMKMIFPSAKLGEAVTILMGTVAVTILLSLPYLWTVVLIALFSVGIGLVLTARMSVSQTAP